MPWACRPPPVGPATSLTSPSHDFPFNSPPPPLPSHPSALYEALRADGITYVSVGHRPTLLKHHQEVLRLAPTDPGGWALLPAGTPGLESAMAGEERL